MTCPYSNQLFQVKPRSLEKYLGKVEPVHLYSVPPDFSKSHHWHFTLSPGKGLKRPWKVAISDLQALGGSFHYLECLK
jgi:hypothetical protein